MTETSKTKRLWGELENKILSGKGIDIGCGSDPVKSDVRRFDVQDGDANHITKYVCDKFDYVYSSHCLEHMHHPEQALSEWWKLVKPGGHLVFIVPDEDLYEQGYFPSVFNRDHKATFTISKDKSWSLRSYNILDLIQSLDNSELIDIRLMDNDYKRKLLSHRYWSPFIAKWINIIRSKLVVLCKDVGIPVKFHFLGTILRFPIDQTMDDAVCQIQTIIKKKNSYI